MVPLLNLDLAMLFKNIEIFSCSDILSLVLLYDLTQQITIRGQQVFFPPDW